MPAQFLTPLLLKGGLLTGGAATVATPLLAPSWFGQTVEQQLDNETFDRTAEKGKKVDRSGLGEKFFDWVYNRKQGDFERLGQARSDKRINKAVGEKGLLDSTRLIADSLSLDPSLMPTLGDDQSLASYNQAINRYAGLTGLASNLQNNYGVDTTGFKDPAQFQNALRVAIKEQKDEPKNWAKELIERQGIEADKGRSHEITLKNLDNTQALNILGQQTHQANLVRADNKEIALLNATHNREAAQDRFRLGQMQMQMEGRRLDMEQLNINHRNKMQTIGTLMQGLKGVADATRSLPPRSYYTL